jgi:hypothetical protein
MTEYEAVDAVASYTGLLQSWLIAYFTILTAYLVAAYAAGEKLTNFQAFVVTVCFLIMCSLSVVATVGTGLRFVEPTQQVTAMNPERNYVVSSDLIWACGTTLSAGILVSLVFMWQVRHPKTE